MTRQADSSSSTRTPRARRASAISRVSRARSGLEINDGPSARAARTSSRFVNDLEPGNSTRADNGSWASGAGQAVVEVTTASLPHSTA